MSVQPYVRGSTPSSPASLPAYIRVELEKIQTSLASIVSALNELQKATKASGT